MDNSNIPEQNYNPREQFTSKKADPTKDAGWIVDTPWRGTGTCVFHAQQQGALAQAEILRINRIKQLENEISRLKSIKFKAEFSPASDLVLDLTPYLVKDEEQVSTNFKGG